jgi:Na+/melibiose symporter-like transporter
MLWWLIGVWLASGAVLPVFWLLSMAYHAASKRIGPKGLYVLSGLVSIGALILLFVCPFRDSDITMREMTSARRR